jgi:hypothetical protein
MHTRITVSLDQAERRALYNAAHADVRPLRDQARWLIRQGLAQRGLLKPEVSSSGELVPDGEQELHNRVKQTARSDAANTSIDEGGSI